jgi:hypothetical protein
VGTRSAAGHAVGGREVALTCRQCNGTACHSIDAELAKAHEVREWNRQGPPKEAPLSMP